MRRAARDVLVVGLLAAFAVAPRMAPGDAESRRLGEIRQEIEAREAKARVFAEEAQGVLGELEAIDREMSEVRRSLRALRAREVSARRELVAARAGQERAAADVARTRRELESRLVALYKFAAAGGVATLHSAGDFQSFVRRREGLARILDQDRELFERHRASRARWEARRSEAEALVAELDVAADQIAAREKAMRRKLVERKNAVALLRTRSDREHRAAEELRTAARRLERMIASAPQRMRPSMGRGLASGRVEWPVEGSVRLPFGRQIDPEFGTETVRNGVELDAVVGSPVRAVAPGRVLFSGWFRGYGQMVIIDHGRGSITVSGYLEELQVKAGDSVNEGDVIATVGETGSLTGPGLYFEIRQNGKPVDPGAWLQSR